MKKKILGCFVIVVLLAVLAAIPLAGYYLYFKPNDEVVPAFAEGELVLVVEGEKVLSKNSPKILEGEVLLPFDIVKEYFDPHIFWDEALGKVTITTKDRVIRMKTDKLDAIVNNQPITLNIPVTVENDVVYIPIEFLAEFYGIEVSYVEKSNVVIIDYKNSIKQIAEPIDPEAVVRKGRSIREPIIRKFDLSSGDTAENTLRIFEEYDKWYKVRTWDGAIGYIEKRFVVVKKLMVEKISDDKTPKPAWTPPKGKINLAWDMIYTRREDHSSLGEMKGLDVISPTWFQVKNAKGELINRAYSKYVDWAHSRGYQVWALLSNDFTDSEMTSKFLNNTDARDNLIREILAYAALYNLDGINIDFENMYISDRDVFTQFVREIAPLLREQGLVVSVDVNDIQCYDKKALSEAVDYIMYMSYDQHWSTSPVAGSVAQVSWQEKIVKRVLEQEGVPREKLLLGIPFYTRLWKETVDESGKKKLTSSALTMKQAKNLIIENNAKVEWDEESGQFYAEYTKDNTNYRLWLEDANSINLRTSLVHKYRLAGTCAWSIYFVSEDIWDVLNKNLKEIESYQEWLEQNRNNQYKFP
ncbi:MAG TPA: glycoside hydrolase [Hungateiclostridium thermocellum]|jgi:spore germination protein YaaH|uniref:Glycoside hydrolase family 18 n=2 Tax=Acetivibrio thermocellus TaxID=1515 RepID=A3DJG4_ACET2|nr:glycosyl hydrolase family 18 protein [Acetivibrio thermocellus]ABN54093.1 glycoside hydrolase family 18 [Acetivibrio thermocellus ATCC 27405]ADU73525.1 glycoside hydrolase family 18 [Acetivibrio thermocellus DSM 1313]ALX07447.1 glycoside hydrolase family 18 [Acetivibrio thermocellus AD2]ANV75186.1 glycoside hydrolase family 18 [Acetivibrio thermocellus DSM 2360]EIC04086.1 glycoside hydrolase family 18 [Acetivibrio thermocellus YS]